METNRNWKPGYRAVTKKHRGQEIMEQNKKIWCAPNLQWKAP